MPISVVIIVATSSRSRSSKSAAARIQPARASKLVRRCEAAAAASADEARLELGGGERWDLLLGLAGGGVDHRDGHGVSFARPAPPCRRGGYPVKPKRRWVLPAKIRCRSSGGTPANAAWMVRHDDGQSALMCG